MRWIFNTYIYVAYMHGAYVEINEHTEKNTVASDSFIYTNESNNRMAQWILRDMWWSIRITC